LIKSNSKDLAFRNSVTVSNIESNNERAANQHIIMIYQ